MRDVNGLGLLAVVAVVGVLAAGRTHETASPAPPQVIRVERGPRSANEAEALALAPSSVKSSDPNGAGRDDSTSGVAAAPARPGPDPCTRRLLEALLSACETTRNENTDAATKDGEANKPADSIAPNPDTGAKRGGAGDNMDELDACVRAASPEVLIAAVPDPSDLGSYYLEQSLEAMKLAVQGAKWLSHREYLPWFAASDGAEGADRCEERVPGLVVFRRAQGVDGQPSTSGADARWLALLLVGESARAGVNVNALERALKLWQQSARRSPTLRLLAPTFSGSAESIADTLGSWAIGALPDPKARPNVRMISGTATDAELARRLEQRLTSQGATQSLNPPGPSEPNGQPTLALEFDSASVFDRQLTCAFYWYLKDSLGARIDRAPSRKALGAKSRGIVLNRVALLVEPGTQYGVSVRSSADEVGAAATQANASCPTPEHVLEFPPHLPLVRTAHERRATTSGHKTVPGFEVPKLTLDAPQSEPTRLPGPLMQISDKSLAAEDIALSHLLRDLVVQGVEYVGIVATDTADTIFLARMMRQSAPDIRLFTFGGDALLVHPDHTAVLGGMLTITSFPLSSAADRLEDSATRDRGSESARAHRQRDAGARALIGDYARGVHAAMQSLLTGDHLEESRPVWVQAIGNGGAWPIGLRDVEQPSSRATPKAAVGSKAAAQMNCAHLSDPAAWKALFILLCLLGFYHGVRCIPLPRRWRSVLETRVLPTMPPLVRPLSYFGQRAPARPAEHVEENQLTFVAFVGLAALTGTMSVLGAACLWACGPTPLKVTNGILVVSGALATLVLSACALSAWKAAAVYLLIPSRLFAAPRAGEGSDAALTRGRRWRIGAFRYGVSLLALALTVVDAWLLYKFVVILRHAWIVLPALLTGMTIALAFPWQVAVTRRWTAGWQRVFSLASAFLAGWAILAGISTLKQRGLLGGDPRDALLTYERWTSLTSGLSPILPGVAAVLFLYVWCLGNLLRLEGAHVLSDLARRVRAGIDSPTPESDGSVDGSRPPTGGPISAILDTHVDAGIRNHEEAVLDALRSAPSTGVVLKIGLLGMTLAMTVLWFVQLRIHPVLTLEGRGANALFNFMMLSFIVALGTTVFALFIFAHRLSKLLQRLARHPLGQAYVHCPPSLTGNLALQLTAGVARVDDLHVHVELLRRVFVEQSSDDKPADQLQLALTAERERLGVKNAPAWHSDCLAHLLHAARVVWQKRTEAGTAEGAEKAPADVFVASLTALTVRELLRHFRYFVAVLTLGALLMLVMISSYEFQPRRFMSTLLWGVVMIVAALCLIVYLRLDRDELLSRIGRSEPSRVTFNAPFARWVLTWVVLPIASAAALQYPEFGRALTGWIVPFLYAQ